MNGIPRTPTDNIYKFMAISGLWFVAGFIALYIWSVNTQLQLDKEALRRESYLFSANMEPDIKARLNSIEKGKLDENRLDWISVPYTPEEEKDFLTKALKNHQENISKNKDTLESNTIENLKLLKRLDIWIAGIIYIAMMTGLTWFGFSRWVTKVHLADEELRNIERDIKLKTLQKIELEISQIKLTNQLALRPWRRTR